VPIDNKAQRPHYIQRSPIKRKGRRGRWKDDARREARKKFFAVFSFQGVGPDDWCAICQICGGPMGYYQADACHKLDASLQGPEEPENYLIGHGMRCGPANCNSWMEESLEIKLEARASEVNSKIGGQVQWTQKWAEHLIGFLERRGAPWARLLR
jgi:hypothetical protein